MNSVWVDADAETGNGQTAHSFINDAYIEFHPNIHINTVFKKV